MSLARCWGRVTNLTVSRALGSTIWDVDGKEYLDCASGIAVVNVGHCHPHVVAAIREQSGKFIHAQVNCHYSDTLLEFTRRFEKHMPEGVDTFFFSNSGAEAVEGTCKLVRAATQRMDVLGMHGAFHGRTATAMALTSSGARYRSPHFPSASNVHHVGRPLTAADVPRCVQELDQYTKGIMRWDGVAGVLIEPIQGEGGFHKMEAGWMNHLREKCTEHGALLCVDEIQSGFGRCGKMFGFEYFPEAKPDVVLFGKGVAAGLPFAGFAASKEVMDSLEPSTHGGTYGGNPVAAAAAIAVLDIMEDPAFIESANARAAEFYSGLQTLQAAHPDAITDVRATGMMVGFDIRDNALAKQVVQRMLEEHRVIMFAPCGSDGITLRMMPPLVVTGEEVARILSGLESVFASLA